MLYNNKGIEIKATDLTFKDPSFGYCDPPGIPRVNWAPEDDDVDSDGFDKHFRPNAGTLNYVIDDYVLPKGTEICRYGVEGGRCTAPRGTKYDSLGLPYVEDTIEYHEYRVIADIHVSVIVKMGRVGKMFDSVGGGIQYKHTQPISLELSDKKLEEIYSWRKP